MNPTPEEIKTLRAKHGLTQAQAAKLVFAGLRTFQHWEGGSRRMPQAAWHLFKSLIDHNKNPSDCIKSTG
jgi:DNA-binding transcriptional regulator YiaG